MSDEVKQAADRLREYARQSDKSSRSVAMVDDDTLWLVVNTLDKVWKANANDEQTAKENALPLSAEILQASGYQFVAGFGWAVGCCGFGLSEGERVKDGVAVMAVTSSGGDVVGALATVGDLRKLLEALHIDATVVCPKGGE